MTCKPEDHTADCGVSGSPISAWGHVTVAGQGRGLLRRALWGWIGSTFAKMRVCECVCSRIRMHRDGAVWEFKAWVTVWIRRQATSQLPGNVESDRFGGLLGHSELTELFWAVAMELAFPERALQASLVFSGFQETLAFCDKLSFLLASGCVWVSLVCFWESREGRRGEETFNGSSVRRHLSDPPDIGFFSRTGPG